MIEWAMGQIRSAEHLIAEENFEVLGLADGLVHEFAEEFDDSRPEGSGSTLIAAAHLMASARNQENGGHFECAMKLYETVVWRWGSSAERSIRQIVTDALEGQIRLLSEIHSSDDERLLESVPGLYDCLIQRFYEDGDKQKAGETYLEKARYFLNRRSGLAWETFERIIELFSGNTKPELRKIVEEALREKWILLAEADAPECVEVGIAYADHMLANPLDRDVFSAVTEVCDVLKDVERYDLAFSLYSALSKKIDSGAPRELAEKRVSVLLNIAICLECGEKYQEAIRAFTDVLIETENDDVNFAEALVRIGRSFREIDQGAHGLSYFDEVIRCFGGMEGVMGGLVAEALFEKAATHRELGEDGDAIASYDFLIRRYRADARNDVKQTIGEALLAKASLLELDGRIEDARRSFDHAVKLFGSEADPSLICIFHQASTERSKLDQ